MGFDYSGRLERLQALMSEQSIDAVLLSVGADLPYFTGYEASPSERLTVLIVRPTGQPVLLVPRLDAPRVEGGEFELVPWDETDDPVGLAASAVSPPRLVAVGDHMWSSFLVDFQKRWPHADWFSASVFTSQLRILKDAAEVDALQGAAEAVDRVMQRIPGHVPFAGRTERQVANELKQLIVEEGHDTAEFAIVGSGPNGASPHNDAADRVIEEGDVVVCDIGGRWDGYYSDSTRTFVVGDPTEEQVDVHGVVLAANAAGREAVAAGVECQEIDRRTRAVVVEAGYGDYFVHRTGHGIGLEVHEHPYMVEGNDRPLEAGMAFSVEPGVYLTGRFGVRVEDIVVCGAGSLNGSDRSLVQVG